MKTKRKLTHDEHLPVADVVRTMRNDMLRLLCHTVVPAFPKTHRVTRQASKVLREIEWLQNVLDTEYHIVTTDAEFKEVGHIYYNPRRGPK